MNYYVCHVEYIDGELQYIEVTIVATKEPHEKVTEEYCIHEIFDSDCKPAIVEPFYKLWNSGRWVRITEILRIESKEDLQTLRAYGIF